jgi:hypothetical protein
MFEVEVLQSMCKLQGYLVTILQLQFICSKGLSLIWEEVLLARVVVMLIGVTIPADSEKSLK